MYIKLPILLLIYYITSVLSCEHDSLYSNIPKEFKGLNQSAVSGIKRKFISGLLYCNGCKIAVKKILIDRTWYGFNDEAMVLILKTACIALGIWVDVDICRELVDSNLKQILYLIDHREDLSAERVCSVLFQHNGCTGEEPSPWEVKINQRKRSLPNIGNPTAKPLKVLHITDIHYDATYKPKSNAKCGKPICCQPDSGDVTSPENFAGQWTEYNCNIPMHFIEETFKYIKDNLHFDYIYFTGDIISHRIWGTSIESNKKSIHDIYHTIRKYFPNTPVLPVLGNHEPHPLNLYAPDGLSDTEFSTEWLYKHTWKQWKHWLPDTEKETVLKGGFYTTLLKPGLRIITINNNVAYTLNYWILLYDEDTYGQLQWLADTLDKAEKHHEFVHILMHIPNGDSYTYKPWARQFARIVERYSNIIKGMFYGHTHLAEMNVLFGQDDSTTPTAVGYNGGSLTAYENVNPNFRIYTVDSTNADILDFDEYVVNITEANLNPNEKLPWTNMYSFKEEYDVLSMSPTSILEFVDEMSSDFDLGLKYHRNTVSYAEPSLKKGCNKNCLDTNVCKIITTVYNDRACNA